MADTGAVLQIRPYAITANTAGRKTGGVLQPRPYAVTATNPIGRTTGAVLQTRPYAVTSTIPLGRTTGYVCYIVPRMVAAVYEVGVDGANQRGGTAWLPSAQTPLGRTKPDGTVVLDPAWRSFFVYLTETRLGGVAGKSIPEVVTTVETAQTASVGAVLQVAAVAQQAQTNAEALSSVREVLVNNAIPGSTQIPPVSRNPFENIQ